jgi:putative transposase
MLVEISPHIALSDFVRTLITSGTEEFPELRKRYWGRHFWAQGSFSITSGNIPDGGILQEHEPTGVSR